MFERHGQDHGRRDGNADAALARPARPRPDLAVSLLSSGYRDSYLQAYRDAHRARTWHEDRLRGEQMASRQQKVAGRGKAFTTSRNDQAAFDRGWHDGYDGKPAKAPTEPSSADAYGRGYRIGTRDRDFARAKELRRKMQQDHDRAR